MTTNPLEIPPYKLQSLIPSILDNFGTTSIQIKCAQALGSEVYAGSSNGELFRFALQADDPNKLESYSILSRQTIANNKPIDEILLIPSISRALILSDNQIHFYTIPALDLVPYNIVKPIRHVVAFTVDYNHLKRPPPFGTHTPEPIDLCIVKRNALVLYSYREKLTYQKEIPLPQGGAVARRVGRVLCIADRQYYNIVDLDKAVIFPILPVSQAEDTSEPIKPSITPVSDKEFLLLSWTGASTLGVFITTDGDPTRGTLEWPSHPEAVCFDYPYVTSLLPNKTIEIHSIESQSIIQVLPVADADPRAFATLAGCPGGYMVPSTERSSKMKKIPIQLIKTPDSVPG